MMKTWEEMTKDGYVIQGKQKNVAVKQMNPTSDNLGELIKSILTNSYVDSVLQEREKRYRNHLKSWLLLIGRSLNTLNKLS